MRFASSHDKPSARLVENYTHISIGDLRIVHWAWAGSKGVKAEVEDGWTALRTWVLQVTLNLVPLLSLGNERCPLWWKLEIEKLVKFRWRLWVHNINQKSHGSQGQLCQHQEKGLSNANCAKFEIGNISSGCENKSREILRLY